ncbi:ThiF family adenylyltransferase [Alkalihalobacterium bogoriense]|uniref:ThiF family adenylyltransferase n=1 Tax=Alkalihalobacterium bogoriense TaxID=246272 RepID=UPI0006860382|nr:ThiF family adenylyltransferase [Alkalihalobacterium bogoriense]
MIERYSRQVFYRHIGEEGQRKICHSHVAIIGLGSTGSVVANHLARAGVGRITLFDPDYVRPIDLQHNLLFSKEDVQNRQLKVVSAKHSLSMINSTISIKGIESKLSIETLLHEADDVSILVVGNTNPEVICVSNEFCFLKNIPLVFGGIIDGKGRKMTIFPGETTCLNCVLHEYQWNDSKQNDFVTSDLIGSYQAMDVIKFLVEKNAVIRKQILTIDPLNNIHEEMSINELQDRCVDCASKHG